METYIYCRRNILHLFFFVTGEENCGHAGMRKGRKLGITTAAPHSMRHLWRIVWSMPRPSVKLFETTFYPGLPRRKQEGGDRSVVGGGRPNDDVVLVGLAELSQVRAVISGVMDHQGALGLAVGHGVTTGLALNAAVADADNLDVGTLEHYGAGSEMERNKDPTNLA